MRSLLQVSVAVGLAILAGVAAVAEQVESTSVEKESCDSLPGYHRLDFWVGEWEVYEADQLAGYNRIEKVLSGCAIEEHWTSAAGGAGQSLFYFDRQVDRWNQIWVTGAAYQPGGMKQKSERPFDGEGMRFQGEIRLDSKRSYLDRTTLVPGADGTVRQLIEVSRDGGATWTSIFDAIYRRPEGLGESGAEDGALAGLVQAPLQILGESVSSVIGVLGNPIKSRMRNVENPHLQAIPNIEASLAWNHLTVKLLVVVCCDKVLLESVQATAEALERFGLRAGMSTDEVAGQYGQPADRQDSAWTYEDATWEVGANRLVLDFGATGLESATWSYFLD